MLRLQAQAHRRLGDHASAAETYERWLQVAAQSHPERREILLALTQARRVLADGVRFAELLGRPFSAEAVEESAGWTDLHYAALLNLPGVVAALIDAGMAADVSLKTGEVPFGDKLKRTLTALGHEEFKYRYGSGQTSLMIAAVANAREAAGALLAHDAAIGAKSEYGNTPLHWAAWGNARETAEWLVEKGVDVQAKSSNFGSTPLHAAAWANSHETAEWLVARGADINATTNGGETPLDYALRTPAGDEESRAATQALLRRLGGKTAEELK